MDGVPEGGMRCAVCKGKGLCGLPRCPIVSRFHTQTALTPVSSYMGASPSVFVGSYNYPEVRGGPLLIGDSDRPTDWIREGLGIEEIVGLRAATISAKGVIPRMKASMQEIALSSRPLDVEVAFERPVSFDLKFDGVLTPIGRSGTVENLDVIDNAAVPRVVDRVTSDTDLGATDGVRELYTSSIDVYQIQNILSAGLLGKKPTVVPTRWAITAVDDMLGKAQKKEIGRYSPIEEVLVFGGKLYGNQIAVLLAPGGWRYEMVEQWRKNSLWAGTADVIVADGEGEKAKRGYSPIAGAYYSARLAVNEYLAGIRRTAQILVVRSVSGEYWAPLGTWVIREATRKAMQAPPERYQTVAEGAMAISRIIGDEAWVSASTLLPRLKTQRRLQDFF